MRNRIDHNINTRQCIANQQPNGCGQFFPPITELLANGSHLLTNLFNSP